MDTLSAEGTARGRTHRENQDRALRQEHPVYGRLFAVIDGVSSVARGAEAAEHAKTRLAAFFSARVDPITPLALVNVVSEIDNEVHDWGERQGAAAMTLAWLSTDRNLVIVHAGDTLAIRWDGLTVRRITPDDESEAGLTRYVGMGGAAPFHVVGGELPEDEWLCLVSDGILKVATDSEIGATLAAADTPRDAVRGLLDLARKGGLPDDATVVVAAVG
jgi:serine/threonine protein phosphatase PrpC